METAELSNSSDNRNERDYFRQEDLSMNGTTRAILERRMVHLAACKTCLPMKNIHSCACRTGARATSWQTLLRVQSAAAA